MAIHGRWLGLACNNLWLQLFKRSGHGWRGTAFLSLHLFRIAQDCQQRSRHHFFTVYFGPPQAMTQVRKQTSFCLFARPARPSLNKVVRGYLGHKSIQTRTKVKKKLFLKEKWVRPLEQLDRMDKHVSSSHCSLLRQPLQSPGPKPPHFILKEISRHLAHSRLTKISSCYSRFILVL